MCNIVASQQLSETSTNSQPRRLATLFPSSYLVNRSIARYSEMEDPRQMISVTPSANFARRIAFQLGKLKPPAELASVLQMVLTSSKVCNRSFSGTLLLSVFVVSPGPLLTTGVGYWLLPHPLCSPGLLPCITASVHGRRGSQSKDLYL